MQTIVSLAQVSSGELLDSQAPVHVLLHACVFGLPSISVTVLSTMWVKCTLE